MIFILGVTFGSKPMVRRSVTVVRLGAILLKAIFTWSQLVHCVRVVDWWLTNRLWHPVVKSIAPATNTNMTTLQITITYSLTYWKPLAGDVPLIVMVDVQQLQWHRNLVMQSANRKYRQLQFAKKDPLIERRTFLKSRNSPLIFCHYERHIACKGGGIARWKIETKRIIKYCRRANFCSFDYTEI